MPRILVASRATASASPEGAWIDVEGAGNLEERIAAALREATFPASERTDSEAGVPWQVLAYDGLPDFGPNPEPSELLAYLDAVDDLGEPFECLWRAQRFDRVVQAADVFADSYQGTYADASAWARHYLILIGERADRSDADLAGLARKHLEESRLLFFAASNGGIHVFWCD